MPIPDHEKAFPVPPGRRKGNNPAVVLDRIVDIGSMMFGQKMTVMQIYRWNHAENKKDPEHLKKWDFSYKQIFRMCQQARAQGSSLLCKTLDEAVRHAMMGYADLQRKAIQGGDFRVAFLCEREMSILRGTHVSRPSRVFKSPEIENQVESPHIWIPDTANHAVDAEVSEPDFDGAGMS